MSFDAFAPHYRKMEAVLAGNILQRCRTSFLAEAANCRRALLLGEGPGRFLVELLKSNPAVDVVCLEKSPGMIHQARRELQRNELNDARVAFEQKDVLGWQPPRGVFDLIVTNFFLDCFACDELRELIANVASSARDQACWLLADFRLPEGGWQRWRARAVLALMYSFFRCTTGLSASRLTPPDGFLVAAGFQRTSQRLANFGLVHADLWVRNKGSSGQKKLKFPGL